MDHLPEVPNPHNPVAVPYLGCEYDNGDFASFDIRQGMDLKAIQCGHFGHRSREEIAQFLQAWLFFGLIQECLQLPVVKIDFIREDNSGGGFITTRKLKDYLHMWKEDHEIAKGDPRRLQERKERTVNCLALSYDIWRGFDDFTGIVGGEVELCIQILAITLEHAVTSVSETLSSPSLYKPWILGENVSWRRTSRNQFLIDRMINDGWCPSVAEKLHEPYRLSLQYYVGLQGPPKARDHRECQTTDNGCRALRSTKETGYKTSHVKQGCTCRFLKPDMSKVCQIIEGNGIPVLYIAQNEGKHELKVVPHGGSVQYTAISHVWADGMGNPDDNSLPLCQLQRICNMVSELPWTRVPKDTREDFNDNVWKSFETGNGEFYSTEELNEQPLYIWIDPICVPLTSQHPPHIKQRALDSMSTVYSRANRVLVLDAGLENAEIPPSTDSQQFRSEVHALITASTWQKRVWTLQEGVQAKRLWFQFRNGAYEKLLYDPGDKHVFEYFYDDEFGFYCSSVEYHDWDIAHAESQSESNPDVYKLRRVWNAMGPREASNAKDIPLCVAILLDMVPSKLPDVDAQTKSRELWRMLKVMPAGTLTFLGPKLEDNGFRWAPSSFGELGRVGAPYLHPAQISSDGIVSVLLLGVTFNLPGQWSPKAAIAITVDEKVYYIRQNVKFGNESWKGIGFAKRTHLGIMLGQERPTVAGNYLPAVGCLGAMVSIVEGDGKTLIVNYLRAVSFIKKDSIVDAHPSPAWSNEELEEKKMVIAAKATPIDQSWLIVPVATSSN